MGFGFVGGVAIFGLIGIAIGWRSAPTFTGGGWIVLVFGLACLMVAVVTLCAAIIGDYLHNRKVDQGQAKYRLPFWVRWDDWEFGPPPNDDPRWMVKEFVDKRFNKPVIAHQYYFRL